MKEAKRAYAVNYRYTEETEKEVPVLKNTFAIQYHDNLNTLHFPKNMRTSFQDGKALGSAKRQRK
jgi:hypothetical protein